jgi:hypothetical protein
MAIMDRVQVLVQRDQEIRKIRMELEAKTGELNQELQGVLKELGLNEHFTVMDLLQKALEYSPIAKP